MHASVSSSTPAAQLEVAPVPDTIEWVQLSDGNTGKTYFWNRRTHVSSWLAPEGMKVVWIGTRDEEGVLCYCQETRVSMYDLPPLPPG